MTETEHVPSSASNARTATPSARRLFLTIAGVLGAGLIVAFVTSSFSQGFGGGFGPGFGYAMRHSLHHIPFGGPLDPAAIDTMADRMIRHLAIELDATTEQQDKLRAIVKSAVHDLLPVRDKLETARVTGRDLLTQSTIDRAALEKLRTDQMAVHEAASKRFVQALADASDVLTPEQRRHLNDMMSPHDGCWGPWACGPRGH
jgi:Spy/CpxP family protein refolding chaperone